MQKRTKKKIVIGVLVAVGIVSALGLLAAKRYKEMTPEEIVRIISEKIGDRLDLNQDQAQKLKAVTDEIMLTREELHSERETVHQAVFSELRSPAINEDLLLDIYKGRRDAFEERLPEILAKFADFHNSLSDEQRNEMVEHLSDMHDHRWH